MQCNKEASSPSSQQAPTLSGSYEQLHRFSIEQPEQFWEQQSRLIHWETPPQQILDYSNPPFRKWFVGGRTNLCFNAVDRHLQERGDQLALVVASSETDSVREFTYRQLYREVNDFAAVLVHLGVGQGDRVVIYMPNMAEAVFAMLACARIGAVHSVVFGGFAAHNLALRIDDAQPKLLITADAGCRGGKVIPYKPLVTARWPRPRRRRRRCWSSRAGWIRRWRWSPVAMSITPACAPSSARSMCRCSGSNPTSPATCCIPAAPPASPRACSVMSVAMRWRWRCRC
jgi:Acyl-coenzyme A synthetases/AMP-(fatty) acid ligases